MLCEFTLDLSHPPSLSQAQSHVSSALLDRIGGAIPTVFSYFAEVLAREKRGEHLSWLCMFWMIGGIYASAMAWAIIPHYGKVTSLSICLLSVLSSGFHNTPEVERFVYSKAVTWFFGHMDESETPVLSLHSAFGSPHHRLSLSWDSFGLARL